MLPHHWHPLRYDCLQNYLSYAACVKIFSPLSMADRRRDSRSGSKDSGRSGASKATAAVNEEIEKAGAAGGRVEQRSLVAKPRAVEANESSSAKEVSSKPPSLEMVKKVSKRAREDDQNDEGSAFRPGFSVRKQKVIGGSTTMKDACISVRHIVVILRGNMITREQALPDGFYQGVCSFLFKLPKFKHLRETWRNMDEHAFQDWLDINIRGQSCGTWVSKALKDTWIANSKLFGFVGTFQNASSNAQFAFHYSGNEAYWSSFPCDRAQMTQLKPWQESFFKEGDWMVRTNTKLILHEFAELIRISLLIQFLNF